MRPDEIPGNAINPHFGPSINQISFRLGSIGDLRDVHSRLVDWGVTEMLNANHGVAWSIYAHDPEGNNLEFFVDSEWYILQSLLNPLDLSLSDDEILAESKAMRESSEGFRTLFRLAGPRCCQNDGLRAWRRSLGQVEG